MDLEKLIEPYTQGDPETPLRWTRKGLRVLAAELERAGHKVSPKIVMRLLKRLGYSLQSNKKSKEGGSHPDRGAQFEFINEQAQVFQAKGFPVISVDAKKKELVGDFKNGGRELPAQRTARGKFVCMTSLTKSSDGLHHMEYMTWPTTRDG